MGEDSKRPEGWAEAIPLELQADRLGHEAHRHAAESWAEAERLRQLRPESLMIAAYLRDAESWKAEARRQELRWKLITRLHELS